MFQGLTICSTLIELFQGLTYLQFDDYILFCVCPDNEDKFMNLFYTLMYLFTVPYQVV
jgi:hypothetical protein